MYVFYTLFIVLDNLRKIKIDNLLWKESVAVGPEPNITAKNIAFK